MFNIGMFTQKLIINAKLTNLKPRTYKKCYKQCEYNNMLVKTL